MSRPDAPDAWYGRHVKTARRLAQVVRQVGVCALWSLPAGATASYPATIQSSLALSARPECTVCHTTSRGGPGTAKTAFAGTLKGLGLRGRGDRASLQAALQELMLSDPDTDGDGVTDVEELRLDRSPNEWDSPPGGGAGGPPLGGGGALSDMGGASGELGGGGVSAMIGGGSSLGGRRDRPDPPEILVGVVSCAMIRRETAFAGENVLAVAFAGGLLALHRRRRFESAFGKLTSRRSAR
jgi:hypothetical protein